MADLSILTIIARLAEHVEVAEAEALLGMALEALDWPVKETYTPDEVVALGTVIAESQRETLRASGFAHVEAMERVLAPVIDGLKADLTGQ